MSAREDYEELKEDHGLPDLEELEELFGFRLDEEEDRPLNKVRKEMVNTFATLQKRLEAVLFLSEGSSPRDIYEAHQIDDKEELKEIYRKGQQLRWKSLRASFDPTDERMAEFITEAHETWTGDVREEALDFTDRMEEGWERYGEEDDSPPVYHG